MKVQCRYERDPILCHIVACPLITWIHVSLVFLNTMALASGIIASARLTHKRIHGNVIIWYTLRLGCYIRIIRRLIERLNPIHIRRHITSRRKGTGKRGNTMARGITLSQRNMWAMGRMRHNKCIQRNRCSGRWRIRWNAGCNSNVHMFRVTSVKMNPNIMPRWRVPKSSHKWCRRCKMTIPNLLA